MPADKRSRPRTRAQLQTGTTINGDATTSRLLSDLGTGIQTLEGQAQTRTRRVVNLVVGANRITHGLGRKCFGVNLSPSVADPTFAWSFAADGDRVAVVTVVGVAQPGAAVEFYA